ncbi:hypothetical protein [Tissierella praeacuta]|uniref:hypothetical protein n=1 Tax=Tissierella praeacuta TaxID=43131 RepID=UPI00333E8F52
MKKGKIFIAAFILLSTTIVHAESNLDLLNQENPEVTEHIFKMPAIDEVTEHIFKMPENFERKPETRATTAPKYLAPNSNKSSYYEHDWSGTKNYTYTDYKFCPGTFKAAADTPFSVEIINSLGYSEIYEAEFISGVYQLRIRIADDIPYYGILTNNHSRPTINGYYKASWDGCLI